MTKEELLNDYTEEIANAGLRQEPHDFARRTELQNELLRRLSSGEPPQPRCPDCKSVKLSLAFSFSELRVTCENNHRTGIHIAADLVKLFGPSAPQPQPSNCILCGCQKEKAVIHQPSGQFVCMDCRDAARRGYAESGPSAHSGSAGQGPEECTCKKPDFQHAICPVHDTEAAAMMGLEPEGRAESPEKRLEQEFDDYEDA